MDNKNGTEIFCGTAPNHLLTTAQAFFGEFLVTSLLILLCCGSWDKRNEAIQDSSGIKFGLLVTAISMAEVRRMRTIEISNHFLRKITSFLFLVSWRHCFLYFSSFSLITSMTYRFIKSMTFPMLDLIVHQRRLVIIFPSRTMRKK